VLAKIWQEMDAMTPLILVIEKFVKLD